MTQPVTRLEITHSADRLIEEYYIQSEAIIQKAKSADRLLTLAETKKLRELAIAIKGVEATVDAGATMAIFVRLTDYINAIDHDFALRLIDFQKEYLRHEFNAPL